MYAFPRPPWMSVSNEETNMDFASYLRAEVQNPSHPLNNNYPTAAQRSSAFRTMNNQRVNSIAHGGRPTQPMHQKVSINQQPRYAPPPSMLVASKPIFKDYIMDPDALYLPRTADTTPAVLGHGSSAFYPYQPMHYAHPLLAADTTPSVIAKIESSPQLPVPSVLPGHVDPSKYESVSHHAWLNAIPDYAIRTPSLVESAGSSPMTANGSFSGYGFGHNIDAGANVNRQMHEPPVFTNPFEPAGAHPESFSSDPAAHIRMRALQLAAPHWNPMEQQRHSQFRQPAEPAMDPATASPQDIEPRSGSFSEEGEDDDPSSTSADDQEEELPGDERDKFLLDMRAEGHSYKEIKRLGNFKEAESTLRGRVRTLTKAKWERPRKPHWQANDVALLHRAVNRHTDAPNYKSGRKLPWKKISEWMRQHGSSHLFAPKTCSKKWQSLASLAT